MGGSAEVQRRHQARLRLVLRWYRDEDPVKYERMREAARAVVDAEAERGRRSRTRPRRGR